MKKRYLVIMLILLSLVSLLIGAKNITISDLISFNNDSINVMLISRVPRLIAIILAGMGMSICGLIMQQISKNKFVSPTTGATIDSAQLGIVVAMILMPNASPIQKALISFAFALAGTYIFMKFIRTLKFKDAIFSCSSASTAWTRDARANSAARGSGWRSSAMPWRSTAARSRSATATKADWNSASPCAKFHRRATSP